MRTPTLPILLAGLALATIGPRSPRASADHPGEDPDGRWKLVLAQAVDRELLLLEVEERDGKVEAEVRDAAPPARPRPQVVEISGRGGGLSLGMNLYGNDARFVGATEEGGKIYGTLRILDQVLPARLERTEAERLDSSAGLDAERAFADAMQRREPGERAERLAALLGEGGDPRAGQALYAELLGAAAAAGRPEREVRRHVEEWVSGARAYGDDWADSVRAAALRILTGKRPYAGLALALADERGEALGEGAGLEARAEVARARAVAARLADRPDVAEAADAEWRRLEARLDDDYRAAVPPFRPEPRAARPDGASDRVVLMELFTGSQSPPCAASEVALDALARSYGPTELIALQYHADVPAPDPLAVPDGRARMRYYEVKGAPSALFNGRPRGFGGGLIPDSRAKYDEYRRVVDEMLEGRKRAEIELTVSRSGDEVRIAAAARAPIGADRTEKAPAGRGDEGEKSTADGSKLRLRLALVEEQVRYAGGSRVRFHRNVVRCLPVGAEGKPLVDGRAEVEATVDLGRLREELGRPIEGRAGQGVGALGPPPEVPLEGLAVVAFVQDDATREVLHAALAPAVEPGTPGP